MIVKEIADILTEVNPDVTIYCLSNNKIIKHSRSSGWVVEWRGKLIDIPVEYHNRKIKDGWLNGQLLHLMLKNKRRFLWK